MLSPNACTRFVSMRFCRFAYVSSCVYLRSICMCVAVLLCAHVPKIPCKDTAFFLHTQIFLCFLLFFVFFYSLVVSCSRRYSGEFHPRVCSFRRIVSAFFLAVYFSGLPPRTLGCLPSVTISILFISKGCYPRRFVSCAGYYPACAFFAFLFAHIKNLL
jgi:hypothetical protein